MGVLLLMYVLSVEPAVCLLLNCFRTFLENVGIFLVLSYVSILCQSTQHCYHITNLEIEWSDSSHFKLLSNSFLNFWVVSCITMKLLLRFLIVLFVLNLYLTIRIDIFTILSSWIQCFSIYLDLWLFHQHFCIVQLTNPAQTLLSLHLFLLKKCGDNAFYFWCLYIHASF